MKHEIILIGMARSGTTLVSHLLGCSPDVYCEIEPHMLWKSGGFRYLGDDQYATDADSIEWMRQKLIPDSQNTILVEKSPPNCIRPHLVHTVFPKAKIVYIERNPVHCINSNYKRSITKDSLKFSIIFRKYLIHSGSSDLPGAIGKRRLFQQLRLKDVLHFPQYVLKMLFLRNVSKTLPFGPKLSGFDKYVKKYGLLKYHVKVYIESLKCKDIYRSLYGNSMRVFHLEDLQNSIEEIKSLYDFCGLNADEEVIQKAASSICKKRTIRASAEGPWDYEIEQIINEHLCETSDFQG